MPARRGNLLEGGRPRQLYPLGFRGLANLCVNLRGLTIAGGPPFLVARECRGSLRVHPSVKEAWKGGDWMPWLHKRRARCVPLRARPVSRRRPRATRRAGPCRRWRRSADAMTRGARSWRTSGGCSWAASPARPGEKASACHGSCAMQITRASCATCQSRESCTSCQLRDSCASCQCENAGHAHQHVGHAHQHKVSSVRLCDWCMVLCTVTGTKLDSAGRGRSPQTCASAAPR